MPEAGVVSRYLKARRAIRAGGLRFVANCILLGVVCCLQPSIVFAQKVVDKMIATVDGGTRVDLITYSDLLWQIALQPGSLLENPSSEQLNRALNLLINQRLILQEADKLPAIAPRDEEVRSAIDHVLRQFPTPVEFERRLRSVGLSASDEQLREIVRQRVVIEKYLDFRFRSFVVITPQEEADYYRDIFTPRFRQQSPGRIIPTLEEARSEINRTLTESKIEADTDKFIENARERAEIIILSPV